MASPDVESPWLSPAGESFCGLFNIGVEGNTDDILHVLETSTSSVYYNSNIPTPPLPSKPCTKTKYPKRLVECSFGPKETKDVWDKLFKEGNGADFYIITEDKSCIPYHSSIRITSDIGKLNRWSNGLISICLRKLSASIRHKHTVFGITLFIDGDTRTRGATDIQFNCEQIPEFRTVICAEY